MIYFGYPSKCIRKRVRGNITNTRMKAAHVMAWAVCCFMPSLTQRQGEMSRKWIVVITLVVLAPSLGFQKLTKASTSNDNSLYQVRVLDCPTGPTIGFSPPKPQPGEPVYFDGSVESGSGILVFTWDFGDGSGTYLAQYIDHTYAFSGVYKVTLTVTGDSCADPPSVTRLITVGMPVYLPIIHK